MLSVVASIIVTYAPIPPQLLEPEPLSHVVAVLCPRALTQPVLTMRPAQSVRVPTAPARSALLRVRRIPRAAQIIQSSLPASLILLQPSQIVRLALWLFTRTLSRVRTNVLRVTPQTPAAALLTLRRVMNWWRVLPTLRGLALSAPVAFPTECIAEPALWVVRRTSVHYQKSQANPRGYVTRVH